MAKKRSHKQTPKATYVWSKANRAISQVIRLGSHRYSAHVEARPGCSRKAGVAWVQAFLAGRSISWPKRRGVIRAVDLFCAAGGLTAGLKHAAHSIGLGVDVALAVDADSDALAIYTANHGPSLSTGVDVQTLVNYHIHGRGETARWSEWPAFIDPHMAQFLVPLDILVAGPPCQGHSNLNNVSRRKDARNLLYLTTVAFAVAANAKSIVIENVPDVLLDAHEVVPTARALLARSGYRTDDAVLSADEFGVAQRRRRHFLVAVRDTSAPFSLVEVAGGLKMEGLTLRQAIGDLANRKGKSVVDTVGTLSPENLRRIDWLFDNDAYDLPNRQRPRCHRNGHTYPSVYGRMRWNEPAQTITTGYLTPGRGRFVHPSRRRTVTPREAARIQGFPDSFDFTPGGVDATRVLLGKVIGDAVPPLLGRAVCLSALAFSDPS
jgi:DNA (cytosine-5)-methyltransferase 1